MLFLINGLYISKGGSCGNLSKGSFETHTCKRRNRRSKEINRASTSQREGGSLQVRKFLFFLAGFNNNNRHY